MRSGREFQIARRRLAFVSASAGWLRAIVDERRAESPRTLKRLPGPFEIVVKRADVHPSEIAMDRSNHGIRFVNSANQPMSRGLAHLWRVSPDRHHARPQRFDQLSKV
jgi:hypothetical protein